MNSISCMKAHKCLRKGYTAILALITDKTEEEKRIENIPVVCNYSDVFPEDLPNGLMSSREVDHLIKVLPRLKLVSKLAYRLSHFEA